LVKNSEPKNSDWPSDNPPCEGLDRRLSHVIEKGAFDVEIKGRLQELLGAPFLKRAVCGGPLVAGERYIQSPTQFERLFSKTYKGSLNLSAAVLLRKRCRDRNPAPQIALRFSK
jgi:hypothetical protein